MTLLQDLVSDTADPKHHRLSAVLLRAKVLATRLKSDALLKWVRNELDGYDSAVEEVPSYRVIYPSLLGEFWGAFGAKTCNVPITLDDCPEEVRDYVGQFPLTGNCASIEALLDSRSETHHRHFDAGVVGIVRQCTRIRVRNQELQSLQALFTDTEVAGVLQAIRSRLLDFLLDLEIAFPQLTGDTLVGDAVKPADIDRLVAKHLGEGSAVVIQTASMEVHMGDSYEVGQAGAVGPGSKASRMTFRQTREGHPADCQELAKELSLLVDALREEAETPEHQEAIGMVMAAQKAVEVGDGSKAVAYLKRAGGWVLGLGEKIGVGVAVRYMVG